MDRIRKQNAAFESAMAGGWDAKASLTARGGPPVPTPYEYFGGEALAGTAVEIAKAVGGATGEVPGVLTETAGALAGTAGETSGALAGTAGETAGETARKPVWVPPETRREIFDGGREVGCFEGLDFARKVITGVQLAKLAQVKARKTYRLSGFMTWDNFCREVLGVNHDVVDEKLRMLQKFGAEFFDAARQVSLNRRTLRELKALPDDVLKDVVAGKTLRVDGEEIPLDEEHADEINAAVAALVAKHEHRASEEGAHAAIAAKENLALKRQIEKLTEDKRKLAENPPRNWIDPLTEKAVTLCSEAVTRIDFMARAVVQVEDIEVRERVFSFLVHNLDRAVTSLEQAVRGRYVVPGVNDGEEE